MKDTVVAEAELHVKKDLLEQFYYNVPMNEKFSLLVHLLKKENTDRVIIFCSKRSTVELIYKNLRSYKKIFGKNPKNITVQAKRTFWKLNFLSEDRIKELDIEKDEEPV